MRYSLLLLLLISFALPAKAIACDCVYPRDWRKATAYEFEQVSDVVLVEVKEISTDERNYSFKVLENFKGNLEVGEIYSGKNTGYCGPYINKKGEWILLGTFDENFQVRECGQSKNLEEPWELLPPPPPPEDGDTNFDLKDWMKKVRELAKEQVELIRSLKP